MSEEKYKECINRMVAAIHDEKELKKIFKITHYVFINKGDDKHVKGN